MNISNKIDKQRCTGCEACVQKCPINAIKVVSDEWGFKYPKVDSNCIGCGICSDVCPTLKESMISMPQSTYVAVSKNRKERKRSSSGGIFAALAHYFLNEGGVVYGVMLEDNACAKHIRIDNVKDISLIQGSKYIQSTVNETFCKVLQDLSKELMVLYSGTPCQIAGLKNFLGKEYDKLYTIDLICHGVSGSEVLRKSMEHHFEEQQGQAFLLKSFRTKSWNHITAFCLSIIKDNKLFCIKNEEDLWYTSYIKEISLRESCYSCQYSQEKE